MTSCLTSLASGGNGPTSSRVCGRVWRRGWRCTTSVSGSTRGSVAPGWPSLICWDGELTIHTKRLRPQRSKSSPHIVAFEEQYGNSHAAAVGVSRGHIVEGQALGGEKDGALWASEPPSPPPVRPSFASWSEGVSPNVGVQGGGREAYP